MSEVESQLFTIFQNFIRDLSKTYPEIKNCLYRNYEEFLISENILSVLVIVNGFTESII